MLLYRRSSLHVLTCEGGGGGRGGAKSHHREKAWASIKHSILFGSINTSIRNNNADIKSSCCNSAHCFFAKDLFLSQSSGRYKKISFFVNNRKISGNCFILINMHAWLCAATFNYTLSFLTKERVGYIFLLSFISGCLLYTVENKLWQT